MIEEGRTSYPTMRAWIMESYYQACRMVIERGTGWVVNEEELGYAYHEAESESMFDTDVERLMWDTLYLILDAGRYPQQGRDIHFNLVKNVLNRVELDDLLTDIPLDEANELRHDLKILGIVEPR